MTTETFKGRDVLGMKMSLQNVGDGLSQAMSLRDVDQDFTMGETVIVVCEARVKRFRYDAAVKDDLDGPVTEVVVLSGVAATITDSVAVREVLDKHKQDVASRKELAGQQSMDLAADDEALADLEERLAAEEAEA